MNRVTRNPPANLKINDQKYFDTVSQIELENPFHERINGCLLLNNGLILSFNGIHQQSLLYNSRSSEPGFKFSLIKKLIKCIVSLRISFSSPKIIYFSIINEWTNNYFHWLTEALPRILYLKKHFAGIIILLPHSYKSEYQLTSLKLLNIKYKRFHEIVYVNQLILPSRQAPYSAHYNPYYINLLAQELKLNINSKTDFGDKIYVTRINAAYRKIANEKEIIPILLSYGFKIIDFAWYSLDEQVSIASNAKILIGIHGAGLSNMIFMQKQSIVLEFSLENQFMDKCYYTLANACELEYHYQFCKSTSDNKTYSSADIVVNTNEFEYNLNSILNIIGSINLA